MIRDVFNDLLVQETPGPATSFTVFDLFKAIEILAEKQPIGRGKLSDFLELGEGTIRTLIGRLKNSGLISSSKYGCSLTDKGEEFWSMVKSVLPRKIILRNKEMAPALFGVAVLVRNFSYKVKKGLVQRDAAVRAGSEGATTLILKQNKLTIPTVSQDVSKDYPVTSQQILQEANPEANDAIVIAFGNTLRNAEYGALAAAWTLID